MKEGWHIETISSLCEQMNGIWKGEKEPLTTAKILRTTNFSKDCQMKLDDLAIIEVEQKKMEKRRLKRGDIIVEKSGGGPKQPVGRVILFNIDDDDFSFCNFTSALRIKDQTKILPEFLHKYLTYLYFSGETEKYQSNLVGFRNLDFKGYVSICVKYPSLSEQQRIVALLDAEFAKIDALKANAEKNLQNAKDLFQAALKKELEPKEGWKKKTIKDVCSIFGRIGYRGYTRNDLVDNAVDGAITLSPSNIVDNEMVYDKVTYISWFKYEESPEIMIFDDDILLVKTGSSYGKCALVKNLPHKATINPQFVVLKNININRGFLSYYLRTPYSKARFDEFVSGTAIPTFSQASLGNMAIIDSTSKCNTVVQR